MFHELIDRFGQRARRMGQMMDRMKVDVVALAQSRHGGEFLKARAACIACRNTAICEKSHEDWLAGRASESPEHFCPNWQLFSEYRERK